MASKQSPQEQTVTPAPANEIISTLPTSQALDDDDGDFVIPKGWKIPDSVEKDLHPLFADSVPEDIDSKPDFLALQSLLYDRDPADLGETFKEEGNKMLKRGRRGWDQAIISYTKAIEANSPVEKNVAVYYSNRAHVHLLKENYGKAIDDCLESIKHDPTFVKSYFRLAKAYLNVDRLEDGLEAVNKGLSLSPDNADLKKLKDQITKAKEQRRKRKEEAAQTAVLLHKKKTLLNQFLEAKGIRMGKTFLHPLQSGCVDKLWVHRLEDSSTATSFSSFAPTPKENSEAELAEAVRRPSAFELRAPLLVCYPETSQTDLIQNVGENDTLADHLASLLPLGEEEDEEGGGEKEKKEKKEKRKGQPADAMPSIDYPPWDKKRRYSLRNVRLFFRENWVEEAKNGGTGTSSSSSSSSSQQSHSSSSSSSSSSSKPEHRWFEVPFEFTLGQLLQQPAYVVPLFPVLYVLDAGSPFTPKFLED